MLRALPQEPACASVQKGFRIRCICSVSDRFPKRTLARCTNAREFALWGDSAPVVGLCRVNVRDGTDHVPRGDLVPSPRPVPWRPRAASGTAALLPILV